jgi:hypothetical protein
VLGLDHVLGKASEGVMDDSYEEEIIVMADVRAYFEVAYKVRRKSFIDCHLVLTSETFSA